MVNCKDCKYWFHIENSKLGKCRRHAPIPVLHSAMVKSVLSDSPYYPFWPTPEEDDACGEASKK